MCTCPNTTYTSVLARPIPKGTVPFGAANVPFGAGPKPKCALWCFAATWIISGVLIPLELSDWSD